DERRKAKRLAGEANAGFFIVECVLDEPLAKQRLSRRLEEVSVSDGRWEVYQEQKRHFEPVVEVPSPNYVIIDTSQPVDEAAKVALDKLD
ncbi:MAG: hypothetical protein U9O84_04795, partial [Chloroflexota bacterium]|nr:hypothetical protein [Chloroflexota bacterium]